MSEENRAVVRREMEEVFNHAGNLDAAEEIYDPDYVGHEPTTGDIRGIEGPSSSPPTAKLSLTFRPP
jgi:hypothetical protein